MLTKFAIRQPQIFHIKSIAVGLKVEKGQLFE